MELTELAEPDNTDKLAEPLALCSLSAGKFSIPGDTNRYIRVSLGATWHH
jgi:hypothetical protein